VHILINASVATVPYQWSNSRGKEPTIT